MSEILVLGSLILFTYIVPMVITYILLYNYWKHKNLTYLSLVDLFDIVGIILFNLLPLLNLFILMVMLAVVDRESWFRNFVNKPVIKFKEDNEQD